MPVEILCGAGPGGDARYYQSQASNCALPGAAGAFFGHEVFVDGATYACIAGRGGWSRVNLTNGEAC